MATVIPGDALLRKTFTYKEPNWGTEHNRNWTESVRQMNDTETRVDTLESDIALLANTVQSVETDNTELLVALGLKLSKADFDAYIQTIAIARLTQTAASAAESIAVTPLVSDLRDGDRLLAFNLATGETTPVTLTANRFAASVSLAVEALSDGLPIDSPLIVDARFLQQELVNQIGGINSTVSRVVALENGQIAMTTNIQNQIDDIRGFEGRVGATERTLMEYATTLQQTATGLTLRATTTRVDAMDARLIEAEGTLTIQSDEITAMISTLNTVNGIQTTNNTRLTAAENGLSLLSQRVTSAEGSLTTLTGELTVERNRITSAVSSVNVVEATMSALNTRITQTESDISLGATRTDVIQATGATAIARVTGGTLTGSLTTTIPCTSLTAELLVGEQIVLTNAVTLANTICVVSQVADVGDNEIRVESLALTAPADSQIHYLPINAQSRIQITADEITSTVTRRIPVGNRLGTISVPVTAGVSTSAISLASLASDVKTGEVVIATDTEGLEAKFIAAGNVNKNTGSVVIPVQTITPTRTVPVTAPVELSVDTIASRIRQTADEISLRVASEDLLSELNIQLGEITIDTNVFRSADWNGTVVGDTITVPGTVGWAFVGNDAAVTGSFKSGAVLLREQGILIQDPMFIAPPTLPADGRYPSEADMRYAPFLPDYSLRWNSGPYIVAGRSEALGSSMVFGSNADGVYSKLDMNLTSGDISITDGLIAPGRFSERDRPSRPWLGRLSEIAAGVSNETLAQALYLYQGSEEDAFEGARILTELDVSVISETGGNVTFRIQGSDGAGFYTITAPGTYTAY